MRANVVIDPTLNKDAMEASGLPTKIEESLRKTIEALSATCCIIDSNPLLFTDDDFASIVEHPGLVDAMAAGA